MHVSTPIYQEKSFNAYKLTHGCFLDESRNVDFVPVAASDGLER
jgi:hypothetical protein